LLTNPEVTHRELAQMFGFASRPWVSEIIASEVFQAELARRRRELMQPIEERLRTLLSRSLEVMQAKLDRPAEAVPDPVALRAFEVSAKALGYGAGGSPPAPKAEVNVVAHLEELARNLEPLMRRREAKLNATVEGEVVAPPAALPKPGRG